MKKRIKNILSFVLRLGLSAGLLAYLFSKIDVNRTAAVLKEADLLYIVYAFGAFLFIYVFLLWRWGMFIRALGLAVPVMKAVRYYFIGLFGNLFLPTAVGGDVIKIIGLCRHSSEKPKVVASVLLDRLSGFAGMSLLALLVFPFAWRMLRDVSLLGMVVGMGIAVIVCGCVLFIEPIFSFCCRIFGVFPKIKASLMRLHYDVALLKGHRGVILQSLVISAVSQAFLSMSFYFAGKALHQDISFLYFLVFMPLVCVASSMPSIGGLGVREAGAAYLFAKVGVEPGVAVSMSLINFLFMAVVGVLGGAFYLATSPQEQKLEAEAVAAGQ